MVSPTPQKIAWEKRHSDDSGVERAVRFNAGNYDAEIEIENIHPIDWPLDDLDWLIECLTAIRDNLCTPPSD